MNEDPRPPVKPEPAPEQSAEKALKDPVISMLIGAGQSFLGLAYPGQSHLADE